MAQQRWTQPWKEVFMEYFSTRGATNKLTASAAILTGLAGDGGLFVPEKIPELSLTEIEALKTLSYEERAQRIISEYLTDYSAEELRECMTRAYAESFDDIKKAPLKKVGDDYVLELWHGPTSAFKDMALQLMPQLMSVAREKAGEENTIIILVATSGDTGKAALEGFADTAGIKIMVFYPEGGVSDIQRLQMVTQEGNNVAVVAVKGNFDDAQSGVKDIFNDEELAAKLLAKKTKLSSANSINWGRLVPQIVYYFSAYADLLEAGEIQLGDEVNFTVPTGNFGNILAGFYAKRMGLPVGRLVCASNENNVLTEFLTTGAYDRHREFFKTLSPSMDILISSNLERLLYHLTNDTTRVAGFMSELAEEGHYYVGERLLSTIKDFFAAGCVTDGESLATIGEVFSAHGYTLDTHTAIAYKVAADYKRTTGDTRPMVIISTASPYKFGDSVLRALGKGSSGLGEFQKLTLLEATSKMPIPKGLSSLRDKNVRHQDSCARSEMTDKVLEFSN